MTENQTATFHDNTPKHSQYLSLLQNIQALRDKIDSQKNAF